MVSNGKETSRNTNWFQTMLSFPPAAPLTSLQKFTAWSAFVMYLIPGLAGGVFPQILNFLFFNMEGSGRDLDYMRICCMALAQIGFWYIVNGRSCPRVEGNGAILGTVPERVFFISGALIWMYLQSLIPFSFAIAFTVLDSTLAIVTFIIWYQNTPGASLLQCLKEIVAVMLPVPFTPMRNLSSSCSQITGYGKLAVSLIFTFRTDIAQDVLGEAPCGEFAKGLISVYFMANTAIGWLEVIGSGNGNDASPIAAVFYRLAWNVPMFTVMYYFGRIEQGFAAAVVVMEAIAGVIVTMCLGIDDLSSKKTN